MGIIILAPFFKNNASLPRVVQLNEMSKGEHGQGLRNIKREVNVWDVPAGSKLLMETPPRVLISWKEMSPVENA